MAAAFNMLRPLDLIWPYLVNTYIKGVSPQAFDLLFWNSDSTRMGEANHKFYMRNCYLENKLAKGEMMLAGEQVKLGEVRAPIYNLAAREDSYRAGALGLCRLAALRIGGHLCALRQRSYRRCRQSTGEEEVSVLDRRQGRR